MVSAVLFASLIGQCGVDVTVVRVAAASLAVSDGSKAKSVVLAANRAAGSLAVATGLCVVAVGAFLSAVGAIHSINLRVVVVTGLWAGATVIRGVAAESFRGLHDFKRAALYGTLLDTTTTLSMLGLIVAASLPLSVPIAVGAATVSTFVVGMTARWEIHRRLGRGEFAASPAVRFTSLVTGSIPMLAIRTSTFFIGSGVDVLLLAAFTDHSGVAVYGAASRLAALMMLPSGIIQGAIPSLAADLIARREITRLRKMMALTAGVAAAPAVVLAAVCLPFGAAVLGALFGSYYESGTTILRLLVLGNLVAGSSQASPALR